MLLVNPQRRDDAARPHWEGRPMPQYDFQCKKCRKKFSLFMSISEKGRKRVACPACKGRSVEQLIMPFQTKTSRKS